MMMGPSLFRNRGESRALIVLGVVLAVGIFISPWLQDVGTSVLRLRGDGGGEYALLPKAVLIERLRTAEENLQNTRYQSIAYETVTRELADLRTEVGARALEAHMTARILATPPRSHYDTILIFAGEEDGVAPNDIVMVEGVALGVVTELRPFSSIVELYSMPGTERDAKIGDATVVAYGVGGGALEARVPDELMVVAGDPVSDPYTGYVIGIVQSVEKREIDTDQYVRIALPTSFSDLVYVSLVHRVE